LGSGADPPPAEPRRAARADRLEDHGPGERPQLPKRRRQEHLVPELRDVPAAATQKTGDEPELEHDPGLMAAFQRGFSLAEAPDAPDESIADSSR
ncbi:hypothetical protein AB0C51_25700, partial [Streptomyces pathocidini]